MSDVKKFVPRTDQPIEAMQVPVVTPMMAEKDREELFRPIGAWLMDHVDALEINHIHGIVGGRAKNGWVFTALSGDWIMVRTHDVVSINNEEFLENYEEHKEFDIDFNHVAVKDTDPERPGA